MEPTPEVTTAATPEPTAQPTAEPTQTPTAAPSQSPAPTPRPKTVTFTEVTEGAIELADGEDTVILPAALLEEVVFALAPLDAPINQGTLRIDTQLRRIEILVIELATVTFTAAEIGELIEFTLLIPGFESSSMTVLVKKQSVAWFGWIALAVGLTAASVIFWFILLARRRREEKKAA